MADIRTLVSSGELVLTDEDEVINPLDSNLRVYLPEIGGGSGVAVGRRIVCRATGLGSLEVLSIEGKRVVQVEPESSAVIDAGPNKWIVVKGPSSVYFPIVSGETGVTNASYALGDVRRYGAVAGAADNTASLANWALSVEQIGDGYVPAGVWAHDGSLTIAPEQQVKEVRIRFDAEAYLAPTAGWGLKLEDAYKSILDKPRVKLVGTSTATRGIWMERSRWTQLNKPVVWSDIEIPADFTCIDVDDNTYWCEVQFPVIRKNSGSITSNFAKGVRFTDVSNAGVVWGGSINHCDDGVYVDGVNATRVIAVAFEDCTDGVEFAEGPGGVNGGVVAMCRFEAVTNDVNMSWTTAIANSQPIQIVETVYSTNGTVLNPNGHKLYEVVRGSIRLRSSTGIEWASNDVTTTTAAFVSESGGGLEAKANGNVTINADKDGSGAGEVRIATGSGGTRRFTASPTGIGFYTSAAIAKPSVTGSRGGNAALASLLTALSNLGLVTDNSTA